MQSSYDCISPTSLQCITHPYQMNVQVPCLFYSKKEKGWRMSQIKHFVFPREKMKLLILSLLQHSVSACNISPALLGWNRCPPTALSSATINSSAPVPGLSWESSAGLCLLWAAQGRRRWPEFLQKQPEPKPEPAQDDTGLLLILVQHRQTSMVCYKWEMHHHMAA